MVTKIRKEDGSAALIVRGGNKSHEVIPPEYVNKTFIDVITSDDGMGTKKRREIVFAHINAIQGKLTWGEQFFIAKELLVALSAGMSDADVKQLVKATGLYVEETNGQA